MRIVFFGTPALAVPSLARIREGHEVCAVVCRPDKPQGRSKKLVPPAVKVFAVGHGIDVHQPQKLNDGSFEEWLKEQAPELCALVAYGRILKQPILDVPPKGFLNLHPSLLPLHRGPSPIQTAIMEGDTESGVTIMGINMEMDAGDVLLQNREAIDPADTAVTLGNRLAEMGAGLFAEALSLVESGTASFTPQDHDRATYTKMIEKNDGRIRWEWSAARIHNLVRGAQPWPVAHAGFRGSTIRIHETQVVDGYPKDSPGAIVHVDKESLVAATGEGHLAIRSIQPAGKRVQEVAAFLRGYQINPDDSFEDL